LSPRETCAENISKRGGLLKSIGKDEKLKGTKQKRGNPVTAPIKKRNGQGNFWGEKKRCALVPPNLNPTDKKHKSLIATGDKQKKKRGAECPQRRKNLLAPTAESLPTFSRQSTGNKNGERGEVDLFPLKRLPLRFDSEKR